MYTSNLMDLIGKEVEVMAAGMIYTGTLIEVSETEVFLQSNLGWIQIQVENVTEINPK